jgi:peptide/nickel transport system substrate-binding protein
MKTKRTTNNPKRRGISALFGLTALIVCGTAVIAIAQTTTGTATQTATGTANQATTDTSGQTTTTTTGESGTPTSGQTAEQPAGTAAAPAPAPMAGPPGTGPKHGIAMYGDPAESPDFTHLSYANPDAPQTGRISYGVVGNYDSLNPFVLNSMRTTARGMWDPEYGQLVFESLMTRSKDEPFTLYGLLAESAEMPEDRSWIEFTLNKDAKWQDGKPVTPEDVIFTYELLTEKGRPPFSSRTKRIASIDKTGDRKVRFTFNETSNREYPLIIAGFTPVLPKHAIDVATFDQSSLTPMLGSGPYKVKTVDPGKKIVYEKDPNYWGKNLPVNKGMLNFNEIGVEYFLQQTSLFEAFKKGLVDVYTEGDPAKWQRAYDFDAVTSGKVIKQEFVSGDPANMTGFVFNTRRPIFANRAIREALSLAFDFETINKNLFFDAYKRTESFWQGSELSAIGVPANDIEKALLAGYPDAVQPDIIDGSWRMPVTDGSGADRKILREVLKRLQDAGVKRDGSTLVLPDGTPFQFEIMTRDQSEEKIALSFQQTLQKLGINLTIRTVDDAQYQKRLQTFDYDMIIATYSASLSPGIEQTGRWGTEAKTTEGSFNYAGVSDPAVDHLMTKLVEARGRDDFIASVRALDRVLLSGHYVIPLYHLGSQRVAYWSRLGHPEKTALYGNQLPTWWFKGE